MSGERAQIVRAAGEDDRTRPRAGQGGDDGIGGRDRSGAPGRGTQAGRFAGLHLVESLI